MLGGTRTDREWWRRPAEDGTPSAQARAGHKTFPEEAIASTVCGFFDDFFPELFESMDDTRAAGMMARLEGEIRAALRREGLR